MVALGTGVEKTRMSLMNFASANAGLLLGLTAVAGALKFAVDQAAEAELVDAKLAAVLKSTGGAAGMTAGELDRMALSLSRLSTYDDEAIKGSEALLLTFTKVGREVFPEAQRAILDMSAALGQDLQSSTIQLGKALNDPIAGITALKRVGVSFTEEQRNMIEVMVKSGDTLGAQKLILHELSVEFGGQAAAAANTFKGQIMQLQNEVGNLGEAVGEELTPEIKELVVATKDATIWITDNFDTIRQWVKVVKDSADAFQKLTNPMLIAKDAIVGLYDETRKLTGQTDELDNSVEKHAKRTLPSLIETLHDEEAALKAVSDANRGMIDTIGDMQNIEDNYQDTIEDIEKRRADLAEDRLSDLEKNEAAMMKNAAAREKIAEDDVDALERNTEVAKELALEREEIEKQYRESMSETTQAVRDNEEAYRKANLEIISGLVERKLMQDGVLDDAEFEWLLQKRQEWGIYSADVVEKARAAWAEADHITASIHGIPDVTTKTININTVYGHSEGGAAGVSGSVLAGGHSAGGADFWSQPWNQFNGGDNGDTGLFSQGFAGLGESQANYLRSLQTSNAQQQQADVVTPGQSLSMSQIAQLFADALASRGVGR